MSAGRVTMAEARLSLESPAVEEEPDDRIHNSRSTTDEGFFDASEGMGRGGRKGSGQSPSPRGDNAPYVQLSNFAGLSSPSLTSIGKEGSVISSLSSFSDHQDNFRKLSEDRESDHPSLFSDEDAHKEAEEQYRAEKKARKKANQNAPPRILTVAEEIFIFQELFQPNFFSNRVKVTTSLKDKHTVFKDNLRLVQEVKNHDGPIWTMKFSPTGLYLASGGQDGRIFVWCVASNTEMTVELRNRSRSHDASDASTTSSASDSYAPVNALQPVAGDPASYVHSFINPEPYRVFEGHSGDVIDLSWSKSCFILSASVDKTIRLWHVTRNDCLQYFRHPDIVTAVEFHPLHDRYFVSGCFDRKLRVWDIIPDGAVRMWVQATDTITAVAFSPDGNTVAGGLIQGQVYFFEYETLKHLTQMDCKNHAGRYKRGAKVTGLAYLPFKPHLAGSTPSAAHGTGLSSSSTAAPHPTPSTTPVPPLGSPPTHSSSSSLSSPYPSANPTNAPSYLASHMLVSTNDNRLRLCRLEDYSVQVKYKGLKNKAMQIKGQFSEDGRFVICGSDTGHVHIWRTQGSSREGLSSSGNGGGGKLRWLYGSVGRNNATESFHNSPDPLVATTVGIFAPIEACHSYLTSQVDFLDYVQQRSGGGGSGGGSGGVAAVRAEQARQALAEAELRTLGIRISTDTGEAGRSRGPVRSVSMDEADLCTRIVATADTDGTIRIYFRVNSATT